MVVDEEPRAVQQDRGDARDDTAHDGTPADPLDDACRRRGSASSGSPTDRTVSATPMMNAARATALPRRPPDPQHERGGQRDEEQERDVAEDQVLELDLERVVEHGDRGQRGDPGRGAEPVPGQRVHHHADGHAHQMLQDRYDRVAVQRLEDLEEDRVPGHACRVRVEVDHVRHVLEGVVEPDLPLVSELSAQAQADRGYQDKDENPVLTQESAEPVRGRQRAEPAQSGAP